MVELQRFMLRKSCLLSHLDRTPHSSAIRRHVRLDRISHSRQHHALAVASEIIETQPSRKFLAVHARPLALEPHPHMLQLILYHSSFARKKLINMSGRIQVNNVRRNARMGLSVTISEN